MSLPIPDLDDRGFDDLMREALSLIPIYNKEWTNFNPSDPGITIIELFAWLTEMLLYRINRIPCENYEKFLKMIGIAMDPGEGLDRAIRRGLESLSGRYRAVTSSDYEALTLEFMNGLKGSLGGRVICVNNRDLEYGSVFEEKPAHVSVIVIPGTKDYGQKGENDGAGSEYLDGNGQPSDLLKRKIKGFLDTRRLIATCVHVVGPIYRDVRLKIWISPKENTAEKEVLREASNKIKGYLDPVTGGPDGTGWPLGRNLYHSELCALLEGVSGIDYVARLMIDDSVTDSLEIQDHELIALRPDPEIKIRRAYE